MQAMDLYIYDKSVMNWLYIWYSEEKPAKKYLKPTSTYDSIDWLIWTKRERCVRFVICGVVSLYAIEKKAWGYGCEFYYLH